MNARGHRFEPVSRTEVSDREILEILDRVERLGLSYELAGVPFRKSRNAVAGLLQRARTAEAIYDRVPLAVKPENQNGALGPGWWRDGLQKQEQRQ